MSSIATDQSDWPAMRDDRQRQQAFVDRFEHVSATLSNRHFGLAGGRSVAGSARKPAAPQDAAPRGDRIRGCSKNSGHGQGLERLVQTPLPVPQRLGLLPDCPNFREILVTARLTSSCGALASRIRGRGSAANLKHRAGRIVRTRALSNFGYTAGPPAPPLAVFCCQPSSGIDGTSAKRRIIGEQSIDSGFDQCAHLAECCLFAARRRIGTAAQGRRQEDVFRTQGPRHARPVRAACASAIHASARAGLPLAGFERQHMAGVHRDHSA